MFDKELETAIRGIDSVEAKGILALKEDLDDGKQFVSTKIDDLKTFLSTELQKMRDYMDSRKAVVTNTTTVALEPHVQKVGPEPPTEPSANQS